MPSGFAFTFAPAIVVHEFLHVITAFASEFLAMTMDIFSGFMARQILTVLPVCKSQDNHNLNRDKPPSVRGAQVWSSAFTRSGCWEPHPNRLKAELRTNSKRASDSAKFGVPHLCGSVNVHPCQHRVISGGGSIKSNAKNCSRGAKIAAIRGILHRTGPTSVIYAFSSRPHVTNTIIISVTAWNGWTIFPATCSPCSPRIPARLSRGACCRIIITRSLKRRT